MVLLKRVEPRFQLFESALLFVDVPAYGGIMQGPISFPLLYSIFIKIIYFLLEKSHVCNFTVDNVC